MKLIETDWMKVDKAMKNEFVDMAKEKNMRFYFIHGYPSGVEKYKFGIIVPDDSSLPFYYLSTQNSYYKRRKISFKEPRKMDGNAFDTPTIKRETTVVSHRAQASNIYGENHIGTMEIYPILDKDKIIDGISVVYFFQDIGKDSVLCNLIEKRMREIGLEFEAY